MLFWISIKHQLISQLILILLLFSNNFKTVHSDYYFYDQEQQQPQSKQQEPKNLLSQSVQKIVQASKPIHESYLNLAPRRKFATGAVVGYTTARVAIRTATRVLKWCGAAYLISEALHASGILDDVEFVSNESQKKIDKIKMTMFKEADKVRVTLREKYLNLEVVQSVIDNAVTRDVLGSTGFATGAAIGLVF